MKELTVDFICQKLGKDLDFPCNYSFTKNGKWQGVDEYMTENAEEFCRACGERNPFEVNSAECWKRYFELRLADEEEEKNNERING